MLRSRYRSVANTVTFMQGTLILSEVKEDLFGCLGLDPKRFPMVLIDRSNRVPLRKLCLHLCSASRRHRNVAAPTRGSKWHEHRHAPAIFCVFGMEVDKIPLLELDCKKNVSRGCNGKDQMRYRHQR